LLDKVQIVNQIQEKKSLNFVNIYQNAKCPYILLSGLLPKYNSRIKCWCDPKISTLYNFASTLLLTFELSLAIYQLFLLQSRTYCTLKFQCFQLTNKTSMFPCQVPSHQGSCCTMYNSKLHCHVKIIHVFKSCFLKLFINISNVFPMTFLHQYSFLLYNASNTSCHW